MFKKLLLVTVLGLAGSAAGLIVGQSKAYACSNGVCGYFTNSNESAWCNVLPDPSIRYSYWFSSTGGNCWKSSTTQYGHSKLYGDRDANSFINDMLSYLNMPNSDSGGSFPTAYVANSHIGAAFLVDYMLGIDGYSASNPKTQWQGLTDARNNFGTWSNAVRSLAVNSCALPSQLTCPGKSFGVNWDYQPTYFCTVPVTTSGFDPWKYETPQYRTNGATCDHDWRASVPEIVFYWNNGANSFHIGSQCGNAQTRADKLPQGDNLPTGTIIITCKDPNTGLQNAHITFSDPDAATSAEFTVAGKLYGPYNPPSPQDIDLLLPPTTDAYTKQTVALFVKDTGPLGDQTYHPILPTVQTAAPCVKYGCSLSPPDPTPLDPNMGYSLTPGVTVSISQSPNSPTISIVSIVKPGGGSYYSHGQIGAVNNSGTLQATFAGIPPTSSGGGGVGIYTVTWNLYTNGTLLTQCSDTFPVVYLPYANVYGGDVMVGASPSYSSGTSTCSAPNTKAGAYSWNNHKAAGFPGAGAQYAVQTLSDITDFASALGSTNAPPHSLSFANNAVGVNDGQGLFGGNFGAITADCGFTSDLNEPGVTHINGNTTLNIGTLLAGSRKIYEVTNGNVYISSDIKYDTAGWTDPTQIPYFKLVVVGGNIYVGSGVKQLDGIYVAESTSASNGVIYTCAKGNGSAWTPSAADLTAGYYTTCNQTLTVNGAFVAAQVQFERTHGTVGQAQASDNISTSPSPDAEVFNYTPEVWLPRNAGAPNGGYDTITGLPPVL